MAITVTTRTREVTRAEVHSALDEVMKTDKFSRKVFPGHGALGALRSSARRPSNPVKGVTLYEAAYELAKKTKYEKIDDIKFRRDHAILHALTSARPSEENPTVQLQGKDYVLLNLDHLKNDHYTYVDVSEGSGFTTKKEPHGNRINVFGPDGQNLGWAITNVDNMRYWHGIGQDAYAELKQEIAINAPKGAKNPKIPNDPKSERSPALKIGSGADKKMPTRPASPFGGTTPLSNELVGAMQRRKHDLWNQALQSASQRADISQRDRSAIALMMHTLSTRDHKSIDEILMLANRSVPPNASQVMLDLSKRAYQIRNTGQ